MNEGIVLFGNLYAYGFILAVAVLGGVWMLKATFSRLYAGDKKPDAVTLALWIIPCALLGARIVYCLARVNMVVTDLGLSFIPRLWAGGYSLVGALLGGALAVRLYARRGGLDALRLMDACVPAAALVLAVARLAEMTTEQGVGDYVLTESLWFFPFAVPDVYGDYLVPVFFYEALAAAGLAVWAFLRVRNAQRGRTLFVALLWLCATQIFLESFREDDSIRFGFVRFNQLCGAAGMLAALIWKRVRGRGFRLRLGGFAAMVAVLVAIEFALDRTEISNVLLYVVMAAALALGHRMIASQWKKA